MAQVAGRSFQAPVQGDGLIYTRDAVNDAQSDFDLRKNGAGVVWWHDFEREEEMQAFRWSGEFIDGNDPYGDAPDGRWDGVRYEANGGITAGALAMYHPAGVANRSSWWRPLSPFLSETNATGLGNGKLEDDPGANGLITPLDWNPTPGGAQTRDHQVGYYLNPAYEASFPGQYDGNEFYFQCRHNVDTRRWLSSYFNSGKRIYFTRTDRSLTDQEIVLEGGEPRGLNGSVVPDLRDWLSMYRSGGDTLESDPPGTVVQGNQPNTHWDQATVGTGICRTDGTGGMEANCWQFTGDDWDTMLYHIKQGTDGNPDTVLDIWVAKPGETEYSYIWDQPNIPLPYDTGVQGGALGHNAIIMSIYQNGNAPVSEFYYRWCQLIFSRNFIPCPQV
jgi:hypothetical protein